MIPFAQYNKAVELVVGFTDKYGKVHKGMIHFTTREKVKVSTWAPFQLLYVEMAKRGEIPAMRDLPEKIQRKYWTEAKAAQLGATTWKKIWICQSLYLYDLITDVYPNVPKRKND